MSLSQLKESKYSTLILASIFAFTLFLQCCFFHWQAFHSLLISSLFTNPIDFFLFYAQKLSISIFLVIFTFLFKNKIWIIYASLFINFYAISELVYFRANNIFLDSFSFTMIGNMNGFWTSVPMYIYASDFIFFVLTLILIVSYIFLKNNATSLKVSLLLLIFSTVLNLFPIIIHEKADFYNFINPFSNNTVGMVGCSKTSYISRYSVIHTIIYDVKELIKLPFDTESYVLTLNDKKNIIPYIKETSIKAVPKSKLIIILVESFEKWTIIKEITPNICNFINNNSNILYVKKVITQTKAGTSADGQMIINTGLLPIKNGAVCYKYPLNTFPAISKNYKNSSAIVPGNLSVWNQKYMSDSYGIITNYETPTNDANIFNKLIDIYHYNDYILTITMSSHSPFTSCLNQEINVPSTMPELMQNYLKTINYMDENLEKFLNLIQSDSILQNSTIVITGDHTIFPSEIRKEFSDYCKANNLNYKVEENYCPLIIYSPNIKRKTIVEEVAYQMDIYPTILHVIGAEDYYWKGFGVNLLDSVARQNRPISPEDAFELSDKLIKANYFKGLEDSICFN